MVRYRELTTSQKKVIVNGCGGKGSGIPVPNFIFKASCNKHDFYYWRGKTEEDRKTADLAFLSFMLDDANEFSFFKRRRYRSWAYVYYLSVRIFGKKFFNYSDEYKTMKDVIREVRDAKLT